MNKIYEKLRELVIRAGEMMAKANNIDSATHEKSGDLTNMVTEYDVAIQKFLIKEIKSLIPGATFIAEEQQNDSSALSGESCFIIDPIDGTTNFVHGYNHSCISLAMLSGGAPVFAIVYDPYLKEMFWAVNGEGAYLNDKRIKVSERDLEHSILAYGTSPYYKDTLGAETFELAKALFDVCIDVRRCGSAALDLAYLAAGRNDIFFELMLSPWDIAAGALLITEAGGIICSSDGKEIDFSCATSVIASNQTAYDKFFAIVNK